MNIDQLIVYIEAKDISLNVLQAQFQSTLPQGERHNKADAMIALAEVSIHTPARGATLIKAFLIPKLEEWN